MSVISNGNASGGKSVGKFENDRSYCQIKINVPSDGIYDIVIRSMGIGGSKENDIYTDGKKVGTFTSENNIFSDYTVSAVSLTKGDHNIRIITSWGWIELDKITVKTGAKISSSTYNVTSSLVNRNATANTKKLYSFLKDSYGKYVITGQQCDGGINGNEFKAIKNLTGDYPALLGDIPASVSIQAVTDCTVYEIPYRDLVRYWDTDYHTQRYGRQIAESLFSLAYRRLLESYSSPRRRYERLMRQCPTLKETTPLRSIASYLGVTPETVSHIRRDLLKGEKP